MSTDQSCDPLIQQLIQSSSALIAALDAELKKVTDLSSRQVVLLIALKNESTLTLAQINRRFSGVSEDTRALLSPLFSRGLVRRVKPFNQERVEITERGGELAQTLHERLCAAEARILATITEAEMAVLLRHLSQVEANSENGI